MVMSVVVTPPEPDIPQFIWQVTRQHAETYSYRHVSTIAALDSLETARDSVRHIFQIAVDEPSINEADREAVHFVYTLIGRFREHLLNQMDDRFEPVAVAPPEEVEHSTLRSTFVNDVADANPPMSGALVDEGERESRTIMNQ